jgi:hypothetical protein
MGPEDRALLDALHPSESQAKDDADGEHYSSNDEEFEDTLVPGSQPRALETDEDEDNPYADDRFEAEVDDESELLVAPSGTVASSYVDSQLRTEMKYVDAILSDENDIDVLPDADRDSDAKPFHGIDPLARSVKEDVSAKESGDSPQWGSMWSINRGDLQPRGATTRDDQSAFTADVEPANPRELMDFSALAPSVSHPDSPADSMYMTLPEPSVVALADQRDLISRKLREATDRFILLLGPELYE